MIWMNLAISGSWYASIVSLAYEHQMYSIAE